MKSGDMEKLKQLPYVTKILQPKNFANRFQTGGINIHNKNMREGGSDTLCKTLISLKISVWLGVDMIGD